MKKVLLLSSLLLVFVSITMAQNVYIPDANFKNKLIALGVDTSGDGEIQVAEAQVVTYLNLNSAGITNMIGIEAFTGLISLDCGNNQLTSLDVSNNVNLTYLGFSFNQLTSIDVSNNTNLVTISCSGNQLTNLDVSNNTNLVTIICSENQLTSLDVSNNTNLVTFSCSNNQLTSLDVSNNINLIDLSCGANQLTSLDVSNNTNLVNLWCYANQLTNLDISNNTSLTKLECFNNQLTSLNTTNNINIEYLECYNNELTILDVSSSTFLFLLFCYNNKIEYINIKSGSTISFLDFHSNDSLQFFCADSLELPFVQNMLQQYGMTNVLLNSLCTYSPGGNYNTVSGQTFTDFDLNACSNTDPFHPFVPILVQKGTTNLGYTFTNQTGNYLAYLDTGSFSFTPQPSNPAYFTGNVSNVYFANNNNNTTTLDLCVVPNGTFPDVEITLIPINPARPGFDSYYTIQYKNIGTTVANGVITYDFPSNKMSYVSSNPVPTTQTTNQLSWMYSNLQPFEVRTIAVTMNVLPPPTNNINDVIATVADITLANDLNLYDNVSSLSQTLVGAYDPNDKTCLEGSLLNNSKIGEYLHYMVRFQNTGNYPAENVVIVDTLDNTKYDLQSLQIIETSHQCHIDLRGKVLQFYFENIQLADSFSNEPESHGYVVFKLKTKSTLPQNSSVSNKAEIYFDFNPPIITNVATTTFTNTVSIHPETQLAFRCYPNPTQSTLTIETQVPQKLTILNAIGKVIQEISVSDKQEIDISAFAPGIYYLKNEHAGASFVKE